MQRLSNSLSTEQTEIIDNFEKALNRTALQQSTIKQYIWCIEYYMKSGFNLNSIEDYNGVLVDHSVKKRSNIFYSAFKRFIRFYVEDASQKAKMTKALIFPKIVSPNRHRKFLDFKERKRVITQLLKEKHKLMARIQFYTGCRVREVLKLEKGDIYYEEYEGRCAMILNITQKGGQKAPIWILDKNLEEDIDAYTLSDWVDWKYYFIDRNESNKTTVDDLTYLKTNYVWYWRDLKQAIAKCGYEFKDWATHDFRRGIAGDSWSATHDLMAVKRVLRHKRIDTTERYLVNSGMQNNELLDRLKDVYNQ